MVRTSRLLLITAWLASTAVAVFPADISRPAFQPQGTSLIQATATPPPALGGDLRRRQTKEEDEEESSTSTSKATGSTSSANPTKTDSTVALSIIPPASTSTSAPSALPSPFDIYGPSYFSGDPASNCPTFVRNLLSSDEYRRCYPISMLLDASRSFFEAQRQGLVSLVRVLDTACEADVDFCTEYFNTAAEDLLLKENCGAEYERGGNGVKQVYMGLKSYELVFKATCLQDPDDAQYCFASAVNSNNNGSNVYPYQMPINMTFPASATPDCNWCLEETMRIYQAATADRESFVARVYEDAARQMNTVCGPEFVNETLPDPVESASAILAMPPWIFTVALFAVSVLLPLT
ncbi:hypothetical protein B0T11DRAFT_124853 [Plectosphaerella cucumerina]|uniref:DUF7729 domain-containing protein n=1 Tax=Plectosphaerella cucumerina TaxID=40658 RepID=A0A8K0TBZ2_9PEZI|nr:hypothetical protein B0T11DRAFT_124853 [Plectosphaerella cucumerina]